MSIIYEKKEEIAVECREDHYIDAKGHVRVQYMRLQTFWVHTPSYSIIW